MDEDPSTAANVAMRASEAGDDEWSRVPLWCGLAHEQELQVPTAIDGGGSGSSLRLLSKHLPSLPLQGSDDVFPSLASI